jgi:hypothetical protein
MQPEKIASTIQTHPSKMQGSQRIPHHPEAKRDAA